MSRDVNYEPKGYAQYTSLGTAIALSAAPAVGVVLPAGARFAMLKAEAQAIRYRDDGTNPTAANGILMDVGEEIWYTGKLSKLRFIEATAGGVLHVSYYA